jgi:hypothetical protein
VESRPVLPQFDLSTDVRSPASLRNSLIPNGAGAGSRTRMSVGSGNSKTKQKGRRINVYFIRRPFPFTRVTRSLQSEDYGHPVRHLSRQGRPVRGRHTTIELSGNPGAVDLPCCAPLPPGSRYALHWANTKSGRGPVNCACCPGSIPSFSVVIPGIDGHELTTVLPVR